MKTCMAESGPNYLNKISDTAKKISELADKKTKMQKDLRDTRLEALEAIIQYDKPKPGSVAININTVDAMKTGGVIVDMTLPDDEDD